MEQFEKVEKIVEKTGVSYEDAKAALEENGYDLLDAMIALERAGKVKEQRTAYYTTGDAAASAFTGEVVETGSVYRKERSARNAQSREETKTEIRRIMKWLQGLLEKSLRTNFCVDRHDEEIIAVPVLVLVLILLVAFWGLFPILVIGLFFGCRYHFRAGDQEIREEQ